MEAEAESMLISTSNSIGWPYPRVVQSSHWLGTRMTEPIELFVVYSRCIFYSQEVMVRFGSDMWLIGLIHAFLESRPNEQETSVQDSVNQSWISSTVPECLISILSCSSVLTIVVKGKQLRCQCSSAYHCHGILPTLVLLPWLAIPRACVHWLLIS